WQLKQLSTSTGRTRLSKNSACCGGMGGACGSSAPAPAAHASRHPIIAPDRVARLTGTLTPRHLGIAVVTPPCCAVQHTRWDCKMVGDGLSTFSKFTHDPTYPICSGADSFLTHPLARATRTSGPKDESSTTESGALPRLRGV